MNVSHSYSALFLLMFGTERVFMTQKNWLSTSSAADAHWPSLLTDKETQLGICPAGRPLASLVDAIT